MRFMGQQYWHENRWMVQYLAERHVEWTCWFHMWAAYGCPSHDPDWWNCASEVIVFW